MCILIRSFFCSLRCGGSNVSVQALDSCKISCKQKELLKVNGIEKDSLSIYTRIGKS